MSIEYVHFVVLRKCVTSVTEPKINRVIVYSLELLLSQLSARIINAFKLYCQRKLLRVPWTAWRSNQSILKGINPEYSLGALILKLQYFGHLMWRTDSLEKTPMLRKIGGKRRRVWQRMGWLASPTQWIWVWASSGRWWRTGRPGVLQSMGSQRVRHNWATEQQQISLSLWHYSACWCIYLSTKWVNA